MQVNLFLSVPFLQEEEEETKNNKNNNKKGRKRKKKRTRTRQERVMILDRGRTFPGYRCTFLKVRRKGKLSSPLQNDHEQASLQVTVRDQKLEMRWSLLLHCGIHLVVASKKNVSDCQ
jgi:hypothetical protein